jgi:hypothetical protein
MNTLQLLFGAFSALSASPSLDNARFVERPAHEGTGRELRQTFLATTAAQVGASPTSEFPYVYGVAMDWPVGELTATVISASDGTASLYTTSSFGIIGGGYHAEVSKAALRLVSLANRCVGDASPTSDYPYPAPGKVRFYFLTYDGVRTIETGLEPIKAGSSPFRALYLAGHDVVTELRLVVQKP